MEFKDIIGQKRVKEILSAAVQRDRLPHALLFHGPEGVGKDAMALELAKYMNCPNPPCHSCPSCLKISKGQHPDVRMIFPVPSSLKPEEIGALIQEKAQKPFLNITFNKPCSISIKTIRELQRAMSYKPFEGKYKITIISEADKMTIDAANAFLKTLEEPPPETVLVLTTARLHTLLPTIISRCQKLRFDPLNDEEIEHVLVDHLNADPLKARLASRLATGNYRKAREFIEDDVEKVREEALNMLIVSLSGTMAQIVETMESLLNRMYVEDMKNILNISLLWMRDLLLLIEGKDEVEIANIDRLDEMKAWIQQYPSYEVRRWIESINETLDMIDRNVNQQLAFTGLMLKLRRSKRQQTSKVTLKE